MSVPSHPPATVLDNPLHALLDREVLANPYPLFERWREQGPMWTSDGSLLLSDHASCLAVLKSHPTMGSDTFNAPGMRELFGDRGDEPVLNSIFFMDDPGHGRQRNLVSKAFTPRITARFEPWIREIVDELLRDCLADGEFDGVQDLAAVLSLRVIATLLGIPREDIPMLREWSSDMALSTELPTLVASFHSTAMFDREELVRIIRTTTELHGYFANLIHKRRRNPGEDLISSLISTQENGRGLSRREVTNVVVTVFTAAHESTTNLITNGLLAMSRHPEQFQLLRQNPAIVGDVVGEALRYDCPIMLTGRVALRSDRINGIDIPEGSVVTLVLASGNRDERVHPKADRFIADRKPAVMNLAFGAGAHFCLGSSLARLEAEIVFGELARRLRGFHVHEDSLSYRRHVVVRGLDTERITFQL
ncbi:cytochrome P450 [Streptomyces sp. WAC 06725]|uniref:cytochrome P450 n=1 Tax=Streptomyces sp. WAC 06725 TaxID=2203209 RepID=UPI000F741FAE|nr:cytochrome P450 [Streptomyces sp. WAC 06725]RSO45484.1 cytochrome P450 [Streptomyces sp. WAC 06725]